jgi:hypothetical protein
MLTVSFVSRTNRRNSPCSASRSATCCGCRKPRSPVHSVGRAANGIITRFMNFGCGHEFSLVRHQSFDRLRSRQRYVPRERTSIGHIAERGEKRARKMGVPAKIRKAAIEESLRRCPLSVASGWKPRHWPIGEFCDWRMVLLLGWLSEASKGPPSRGSLIATHSHPAGILRLRDHHLWRSALLRHVNQPPSLDLAEMEILMVLVGDLCAGRKVEHRHFCGSCRRITRNHRFLELSEDWAKRTFK